MSESQRSRAAVAERLIGDARELHRANRTDEALLRVERVLADVGRLPATCRAMLGSDALLLKAYFLQGLGRPGESIAAVDALFEQYRDERTSAVRDRVADAALLKALSLLRRGETREAIAALDALVARFADPTTARQRAALSRGLVVRGAALRELGLLSDAIASWQQVVDRFERDPPVTEPFIVLEAVRLRSEVQSVRGELEEALSGLDDVITRYAAAGCAEARIGLIEAIVLKARVLIYHGKRVDEAGTLSELGRMIREDADVATLVAMSDPVLDAAAVMVTGEHGDAVLELLDLLLEKLSVSRDLTAQAAWARTQVIKSVYLARVGHVEAAKRAYERLFGLGAAVLPTWDELAQQAREGRPRSLSIAAAVGRAATLEGMGRRKDALRAIDSVPDKRSGSPWVVPGVGLRGGRRARRRGERQVDHDLEPFIAAAKLAGAVLASAGPTRPRHDDS